MNMKYSLFAIITSLTLLSSSLISQPVQAATTSTTPQLLVINQTRGEECCDPGTLTALESQINAAIATQIPIHFALRYDALTNPAYVQLLKTSQAKHPHLFTFGALVEVTPELAKAAGVTYTGTPDTWFQAKHVLTMGYPPADRRKLLDTFWSQFHSQFGSYPAFSTAWMIDTPSLNYLHDTYNLPVHQITREQAGTDSYHLIGGPPHYPYPASSNWLFIPDYDRVNAPLIVRQTVTDPLRNYGDTTNAFTSQPNDFRLDGKDFSYFEKLITQALFGSETTPQYPTGFALLGLENSMPAEDQTTFVKQLEYVEPWVKEGRVVTPSLAELTSFWNNQPLSLYSGADLTTQQTSTSQTATATWITTPRYRVRLRHQAGQNVISDLRAFDTTWQDPYTTHTATNQAIWIVPYLIDGSTWYELLAQEKMSSSWIEQWFKPPTPPQFSPSPQNDTVTVPHQLKLTTTKQPLTLASASATQLSLTSPELHLTFTLDSWQSNTRPELQQPQSATPPDWSNLITSHEECQSVQNCNMRFTTGAADILNQARQHHYQLLFPELTSKPINLTASIFYIHNRYAIAGRNPVRAVFMPVDELGYPTLPEPAPKVRTSSQTTSISNSTDPKSSSLTFIDVTNSHPEKVVITIETSPNHTREETVFFAPNCKAELVYCLKHPIQAVWFIKTVVNDIVKKQIEK
jgi:hypothetical protein